jgi:hypothetical protein
MEQYRLNDIERRMSEDLQWALTAPEVQKHHGKFVAVHNKQVLAVGQDRMTVARAAAEQEKCHWGDIAVVVVPSQDVWEVPH